MRRHSHNSARTVAHHYVVGNENRDFLAVYGVDADKAVELDTRLVLDKLCALKLRLLCALCTVVFYLGKVCNHILVFVKHRMLGSHNHKGYAKESIGTGCVDAECFVRILNREVYECTR